MQNNNPIEDAEPQETAPDKGFWRGLGDFTRFASIVIIIVIIIRMFIAQPFIVSGTSMVPTFQNSNYLIVDEISYRWHEPQRGDVIVFHPPMAMQEYYIKRIIGVAGDTVNVHNGVVTVTNSQNPKGIVFNEPYISKDTLFEDVTTVVPDGEYFVMGDNRPASYDSRAWGLLPRKNITGRAFLRLFPVGEFSVLPGEYSNYSH